MGQHSVRRWYQWYSPEDTPAERKLILKLDLLIVPYAFVIYWIKYIDQTNINNAYVSGMSEELNFHGNQLVQFQTVFNVAQVVALLPFAYLFPKVPMHLLVPGLDLLWGIFNLLQYRAQSYGEIMAYRFMVGIFEAAYFPAVHFVLGSWYRVDEISRRGGCFYTGLTLATLTSGLLQAAASKNLNGVNGLSGWRWMFIITSIITLPLAFIGVVLWPGTPDKPNRLLLSEEELALARARLERHGSQLKPLPFTWSRLRSIFTNWKFYVLCIWDILFYNGSANTAAFLLWIKSLHRYDIPTINNLGSISPALGIFYILFITFGADTFLGRPGAISLACTVNFIGLVILVIWDVPESAKWFAFCTNYAHSASAAVIYGWSNIILRHNVEERALTLIMMTAFATSTNAWVPLLVYPTVEAPRFPRGFAYSLGCTVCLFICTHVVRVLYNREEKKYAATLEIREDSREEISYAGTDEKVAPEIKEVHTISKEIA